MTNKEIKANLTLIVSMSIHVYVHVMSITLNFFLDQCASIIPSRGMMQSTVPR